VLRTLIEKIASTYGFHTTRFAAFRDPAHFDRYEAWIQQGYHGEMGYLERGLPLRADPRVRLPELKSAVLFGIPYHHHPPPDPGGATGRVARYAWGRDYHNLVGKRLKKVRRDLREAGINSWGGVDTVPILERSWASMAGLGFNGKNTMQIVPASSSYFFIATLFLDVALEPDIPLGDHCGSCTRCLVGCPTQAFVGPHSLDARRCISYWTIESKQLPPRELRPKFGRWFFGCDVCQEVCPHNVSPPDPAEEDFRPRHAFVDLNELLLQPDEFILERFTGTPLRRPGAAGLKRNALIVLGNIGDEDSIPKARSALEHPAPIVRAAAIWCLTRLGDAKALKHHDPDSTVMEELEAARSGEVPPLEPTGR
jgi:epoxyqueuosine reductase